MRRSPHRMVGAHEDAHSISSSAAGGPGRAGVRQGARSHALKQALEGTAAGGALARVTLVFVPVFNVDGHERFGRWNRPNQTGPEEMGWRTTAQNLNLNRDYVKADAPEMSAMLRLLG